MNPKIKLNANHKEHKEALTVSQLNTLADAKFTDVSWASNEGASFASPCQNYELFVNLLTDNVYDEYQIFFYDEDGLAEHIGSCDDLTVALQKIESHGDTT